MIKYLKLSSIQQYLAYNKIDNTNFIKSNKDYSLKYYSLDEGVSYLSNSCIYYANQLIIIDGLILMFCLPKDLRYCDYTIGLIPINIIKNICSTLFYNDAVRHLTEFKKLSLLA
jgi:hypothetical protein